MSGVRALAISSLAHLLLLGGGLLFCARTVASAVEPLPVELVAATQAPAVAPPRPAEQPTLARPDPPQRRPTWTRQRPTRAAAREAARPNAVEAVPAEAAPASSAASAWRALLASADGGEMVGNEPAGEGGHGPGRPGPAPGSRPPRQAVPPAALQPPQALQADTPDYPLSARRRGAEGLTLVRVHVGRRGEVMEAELARTSGAVDLDRSALEAVRSWLFSPGRRGDQPVEAWVKVPVRFRLSAGAF